MSIIEEVDNFMASSFHNQWIGDETLQVYVRKGHRLINGVWMGTFDVANISNIPEYQRKGHFKTFMLKVESLGLPIFVECIYNPDLITMLQKNGYSMITDHGSIHAIKLPTV